MEGNKIRSIFLGQVRRKIYELWCVEDTPKESSEFVEYKKLYECELESPPLQEKEKIYIKELDTTLQVQEIIKSSDGSITYKTNYTMEMIQDNKTDVSYQKALVRNEEYKKEQKERIKKEKELELSRKQNEYIERDGITRCLMSIPTDNTSIIAHFINDSIQLIDTNSKDIITLNSYAIDNFLSFIKHIHTR